MYNSYEEYMQNVLGMNVPNTYMPNNNYNNMQMQSVNLTEVNNLYPDIYRIIYPMVQKACSRMNVGMLNENQINAMVDEVYNAIEPGDDILQGPDNGSTPRNGDVKNPRTKENTRNSNNTLLKDLIKILIIRELLQGGQRLGRPRMPRFVPMPQGEMQIPGTTWSTTRSYYTRISGYVLKEKV